MTIPFIIGLAVVFVLIWLGARKFGPSFDAWLLRRGLLPTRRPSPVPESSIALLELLTRIRAVHSRLADGEDVPDAELIDLIEELHSNLQTNCESAGNCLIAAIGGILLYRQSLTDRLLPMAMYPFYCWGMEDGKSVLNYLESKLNSPQRIPIHYPPASRKYVSKIMLGADRPRFASDIDGMFKKFNAK